jgi:hypothetical protein
MQDDLEPVRSCLGADQLGMTRAVLEAVASRAVASAADLKSFVCCTLLHHAGQVAAQTPPSCAPPYLVRWLREAGLWPILQLLTHHTGRLPRCPGGQVVESEPDLSQSAPRDGGVPCHVPERGRHVVHAFHASAAEHVSRRSEAVTRLQRPAPELCPPRDAAHARARRARRPAPAGGRPRARCWRARSPRTIGCATTA